MPNAEDSVDVSEVVCWCCAAAGVHTRGVMRAIAVLFRALPVSHAAVHARIHQGWWLPCCHA